MSSVSLINILRDELISSTYELLEEGIDPTYHYDFKKDRKNLWTFLDRDENQHFIILNQSLYKGDTVAEIKFGWVDKNGNRRYDKPPIYDERVFNTHLHIFIEEILAYFASYFTDIYLEAVDSLRYRLYRKSLNIHLDKSKYEFEELEESHTLIVKTKSNKSIK